MLDICENMSKMLDICENISTNVKYMWEYKYKCSIYVRIWVQMLDICENISTNVKNMWAYK